MATGKAATAAVPRDSDAIVAALQAEQRLRDESRARARALNVELADALIREGRSLPRLTPDQDAERRARIAAIDLEYAAANRGEG